MQQNPAPSPSHPNAPSVDQSDRHVPINLRQSGLRLSSC